MRADVLTLNMNDTCSSCVFFISDFATSFDALVHISFAHSFFFWNTFSNIFSQQKKTTTTSRKRNKGYGLYWHHHIILHIHTSHYNIVRINLYCYYFIIYTNIIFVRLCVIRVFPYIFVSLRSLSLILLCTLFV